MTNEQIAIWLGIGVTILVHTVAIVWAAAKVTSKVDSVTEVTKEIRTEFRDFMKDHKELERVVGTHSTAIALIAQATKVRIRETDVHEGFDHGG